MAAAPLGLTELLVAAADLFGDTDDFAVAAILLIAAVAFESSAFTYFGDLDALLYSFRLTAASSTLLT